jgi:hypothetical protein
MSFMGFEKIQVFVQDTYVLAYNFAENRQFGTKKCLKLHISLS